MSAAICRSELIVGRKNCVRVGARELNRATVGRKYVIRTVEGSHCDVERRPLPAMLEAAGEPEVIRSRDRARRWRNLRLCR